jgi:hypothetical protein
MFESNEQTTKQLDYCSSGDLKSMHAQESNEIASIQ